MITQMTVEEMEAAGFINVNIDWDNPESLFDDRDPSIIQKEKEIAECGSYRFLFSAKLGTERWVQTSCKHWNDCPKCKAYKISQEQKRLSSLVGKNVKKIVVSIDEEKEITRKYGRENVRRIPIGEDETAFVIDTEDEIGEPLTMDDCESLAKHAIPENGRRISGSLGATVPSDPTENLSEEDKRKVEEEEKYRDIYDPKVEIELWEMKVDFNSADEDAPTDSWQLGKMVRREVDITDNPNRNQEELQTAVRMLEDKTEEICKRYKMSFCFYRRTKETLRMSEVNWVWTKMKMKKPSLS